MAETILAIVLIVAVVAVAAVAFALWFVVLVGRMGFALLMLPFKLLAATQPRVARQTPSRVVERPLRMPAVRVVHVGHACRNPLCRKPNSEHATFCSRCGASLIDELHRIDGPSAMPMYA